MKRLALLAVVGACLAVAAASAAAAPSANLHATPIGRLPFPERGYVVDLPSAQVVGRDQVTITENGVGVGDFAFDALSSSGLRYGVVLAVDTSNSMAGKPIAGARAAALSFVARRGQNESIGLVTFNKQVVVAQDPSTDLGLVRTAVDRGTSSLAYGTRIYDALGRSLEVLNAAKFTTSSIVLLSDGRDLGSSSTVAKIVARAKQQHVRIFTVGLRSGDFDGSSLRAIAQQTGAAYAEASSSKDLARVYQALGRQLAGEYLIQYRSIAAPKSAVDVSITVDGVGHATESYTAPTLAGLPPFHRSFVSRFLLSSFSLLLVALAAGAIGYFVIRSALESARSKTVERVMAFVGSEQVRRDPKKDVEERRARRRPAASGQLFGRSRVRFAERLDIGRISMPASTIVAVTIVATVAVVFIVSALASPVVGLLGLGTPLVTRALIQRKVNAVRAQFADQLPPNLQVMASALRAGHSFLGAFRSCVEHANEPSKSELSRAITDEQLGMVIDDAIRKVAVRMKSRDLEQVAMLAELQRTTGGNAAEILDVVVSTLRERADIRRLVQTLTAQGRMARTVLTILPVATGLGFWAIQPDLFGPFVRSTGGQIAFVIAAVLLVLGSLTIQRIVEIEV